LKINAKRFGRKKITLIFATRFEKRGCSLRQVLQIKAEKKFQVFSTKIWWLKNESYLRRPFNKNGSSCKSSVRGFNVFF